MQKNYIGEYLKLMYCELIIIKCKYKKNREIRLRRRFQVLKNKIKIKPDKRKKLKGAWVIISFVLFSTILGWTFFFITNEDLTDPFFGTGSQEYRRDGIKFNLEDLEYFEDLDSIKD